MVAMSSFDDGLGIVMTEALGRPVRLSSIERLKGGYSRRMWSFDSVDSDGMATGWILCTDSDEGVVGADSLARPREAALLADLYDRGLPVPAIAASGYGLHPFGSDWFVMSRLVGTAAVGPLIRDPDVIRARRQLGRQTAQILARIHAAPVPAGVFDRSPTPAAAAEAETDRWTRALAETPAAATATMQAAVRRLTACIPNAPIAVCIVHGDYRTGNLLYDHSGITGVLDWEMAHPGDPLEDLAWAQLASWRVGTGLVGAMLTDDEWLDDYSTAAGRPIDAESLRFWQILTGVKMSILAWRAYERTQAGKEHDLLLALFEQLQHQLRDNLDDG